MSPKDNSRFERVSIETGKRTLRKFLSQKTKKGHRIHEETEDKVATKQRVLDGELCANCIHLRVLMAPDRYVANRKVIGLQCEKGLSPLELYRKTPFGKTPNCAHFRRTARH